MPGYTTVLVGCGPRGAMHARAIQANPERFELVAACDLDAARLAAFADRFGIARTYRDAETMLATEQPQALCFATLPAVRLSLVELGVRHGVKAIACEKPMALSLAEARRIIDICNAAGVKLVVCHQLKYAPHWQKLRDVVSSGKLGEIRTIQATARPSMLRVGTHLIDAMLWLNDWQPGEWVLGQAHGAEAYGEDHPCPDHLSGFIQFANGVRGTLECGSLAPQTDDDFWLDVCLTVYGTQGYARTGLGRGWQMVTAGTPDGVVAGAADLAPQEPRFHRDLADWLDQPQQVHSCCGETSYHGFELLIGLGLSSLERRQVEMPIRPLPTVPILEQLQPLLAAKNTP